MTSTKNDQKELRALGATLIFHAVLLLLFFLLSFKTPQIAPPPPADEGIEVNLGSSDIGFGDLQPLAPGDPAPDEDNIQPSSAISQSASEESEKEITERDDAEAPVIEKKKTQESRKPIIPKENPVKIPVKPIKQPTTTPSTQTTPKPNPKAVFKGSNGSGGNQSDEFNNQRNQGIAGGNGDQGKLNGSAGSDNYTGTGGRGNGGPVVTKGNRSIVKARSFSGDLPKAIIYASIQVDQNGKGSFIKLEKGSTSFDNAYASAIKNYLPGIRFNEASESSTVTVKFVFDVKD